MSSSQYAGNGELDKHIDLYAFWREAEFIGQDMIRKHKVTFDEFYKFMKSKKIKQLSCAVTQEKRNIFIRYAERDLSSILLDDSQFRKSMLATYNYWTL